MVQIFLIAWGGVSSLKPLVELNLRLRPNLPWMIGAFSQFIKRTNNLLLRISLQESDDEPGPRGGHVEWSDEEEVELEAGGKAMTIHVMNRHGYKN